MNMAAPAHPILWRAALTSRIQKAFYRGAGIAGKCQEPLFEHKYGTRAAPCEKPVEASSPMSLPPHRNQFSRPARPLLSLALVGRVAKLGP